MVALALAALQAARQRMLYDNQITAEYEESQAATAASEAASGPVSLPGRREQQSLPQPGVAELAPPARDRGLLLLEQVQPCRTALWLHRQEQEPPEEYGAGSQEVTCPVPSSLHASLPWERHALATPSAFYHIARLDRFLGPAEDGDEGGFTDMHKDAEAGTELQRALEAGGESLLPDQQINTSGRVKTILEDKVNRETLLGGKLWFCRVGSRSVRLSVRRERERPSTHMQSTFLPAAPLR